jgi:hypothetical protein
MPARGDIWHTPGRSRTLSIVVATGRFSLPALLFLFAALPLHARAQQQDAPDTSAPAPPAQPEAPAAGTPPPAGETPVPAQQVAPMPPQEEEPAPPAEPSGEAPAPPPTEVAPPLAEPAAATAATASASPPAEVEEDEDETGLPWLASLSWGHAYNAAGISRSAYQTFNPAYAWSFNGILGYRFDERTSIALSQGLAIELTDSDTTNTRQEPWLLDTAIDAERELIEHEFDADHTLGATGALGILLPTSKPSRAATMLFAGRAELGGSYTVDDVLHGLSAGVSVAYTHRFLRSNVLAAETSYACVESDLQDTTRSCSHLGSLTNTRDLFVLGIDGSLELTEELTLGAQVSFGWNLGAGLSDEELSIEGSRDGVVRIGDDSLTHWRNSRVIGFSLEYAFTDWFTGATLFTNSFAERSAIDGRYRAPFNAQDMTFGLELTVSFDQLYAATRGHAAGE